ncbi:MAG: DUF4131 domain-containing protein [Eudoraea sp.]|nr:DUF4131 domain-containing protein [Eudoraea sp.]
MLLKFIPIRLTAALILGILLGKHIDFPVGILLFVLVLGLGFLGFTYNQKKRSSNYTFEVTSLILVFALGVLTISLHKPQYQRQHYAMLQEELPETYAVKITASLRPGNFHNRYLAKLIPVSSTAMRGKLLLQCPDSIQLTIDDELVIWKPWRPISPPQNPGQFNYARYMEDQGVYARIVLKPSDYMKLPSSGKTMNGAIGIVRNNLSKKLQELPLEEHTIDIMQAMLLGQRTNMDSTLYTGYKDAGAVHLLAISGLHIGILVLLLQVLFAPLRHLPGGQIWQFGSIVLFLWGYAALAGFTPSVVRAVTMFSFITYALIIKRSGNAYNIIALSLFFILLVLDPNYLFQAGFQMSYAAVFAIIWLYPKLTSLWRPEQKVTRYFWQLLSVSICAQIGVLPISLYYFHQFPGLFFISNILIVPMLGVVLGMGFLLLVLSLFEMVPDFLTHVYDQLIIWMNAIVQWIAQQESLIFRDIPFDGVQLFLAYTILLLFIAWYEVRKSKFIWMLGGALLIFQGWVFGQKLGQKNSNALILYHQIAQTLLVEEYADQALAFMRNEEDLFSASLLQNSVIYNRIENIGIQPLKHSYYWKGSHILLVDKSAVFPKSFDPVNYLVLTDNPKINLDRVLANNPSSQIIADGSNYTYLIDAWRASCLQANRPFHYTGEKGAFYFE